MNNLIPTAKRVYQIANHRIRWGTPTPIQLREPRFGVAVPVTAFGQFGLRIDDSRRFLTSLVGTLSSFSADDIKRYFKGIYISKIKSLLTHCITKQKISVFEINAHLDEIGEYLEQSTSDKFAEYGIKLVNFTINDISVDESNPEFVKLKETLSKRADMDVRGYTYEEERSFDVMEKMAENLGQGQSGGNMLDLGVGAGVGFGMGGNLGEKFGQMSEKLNFSKQSSQQHESQKSDNAKGGKHEQS